MKTNHIINAWKNDDFRNQLSAAEVALLPEHPVGLMEISDEDLMGINGGSTPDTSVIVVVATIAITITTVA